MSSLASSQDYRLDNKKAYIDPRVFTKPITSIPHGQGSKRKQNILQETSTYM